MQKEIEFLGNAVEKPGETICCNPVERKFPARISVINNLLDKVDTLIIGGGMSYTF